MHQNWETNDKARSSSTLSMQSLWQTFPRSIQGKGEGLDMSSLEPTPSSKYILQDYANGETIWFETKEQVAEYLTDKRLVDPDDFVCYELGQEIKFKVVAV